MDRVNNIAEYLDEVKELPPEEQFAGLLKRWPQLKPEEFASPIKTFKVRDLDDRESILLELIKKARTP
jgi:hypothetical protein